MYTAVNRYLICFAYMFGYKQLTGACAVDLNMIPFSESLQSLFVLLLGGFFYGGGVKQALVFHGKPQLKYCFPWLL